MDERKRRGSFDNGAANRLLGVAGLVALIAAIAAGATIWLLITDPVTVAKAVDQGEITPLVRELAEVIYDAIAALLKYL